jgi:hypothetical protein
MEARGLSWNDVGAGRAWTMPAAGMYAGLADMLAHGLTIYTLQAEARSASEGAVSGH